MFINGVRADDLAGTGLVTKQRYVVPFWVSVLGVICAVFGRTLARLARLAVRAWRLSVPAALAGWTYWQAGRLGLAALLALVLVVGVGWRRYWPASFTRHVTSRAYGWWRWQACYRRRWFGAMDGTGLTRTTKHRQVYVPRVTGVRATRVVDTLDVQLLHGHTPETLSAVSEGLRHVFGAYRCLVTETAPGRVRLTFYSRDPLTAVIGPIDPADVPDLAALPVGLAEDGTPYAGRLLGRHWLIAGASGAGKGSVLWSLLRSIAPAIAAGTVELWGIDPKRMELVFGRELFTRLEVTDLDAMAVLLEDAVARMQGRSNRLSGITRQHEATHEDPALLVVIDELASLTAYCTDPKLKARIKAAFSLLLSQGRGVGVYVVAAVQDPRKDIVQFRDLFTVRVALRTMEADHADMILGEGAYDRGAHTHRIPDSLPGVGYVHVEGAKEPVRVRFSYLDDPAIRAMALRWAANPTDRRPSEQDRAALEPGAPAPGPAGVPIPAPRLPWTSRLRVLTVRAVTRRTVLDLTRYDTPAPAAAGPVIGGPSVPAPRPSSTHDRED